MNHVAAWHVAQPLWDASLGDPDAGHARFRAPVLLRFKGDDFMDQLRGALERPAPDLAGYVVRAESWREEQAGWLDAAGAASADVPKLYQPAHFRFYLVCASLVCQRPGLPDRRVEASRLETTSFVLRRLFARGASPVDPKRPETYDEYGWSGGAQAGAWRPVPDSKGVAEDEERIPLFPSRYGLDGRQRRVLTGLVPVARRDAYEAGASKALPPASAGAALGAKDPFATADLAEAAEQVLPALDAFAHPELPLVPPSSSQAQRDAEKIAVAHALLLLVDWLEAHAAPVWQAALAGDGGGLPAGQRALFDRLAQVATGTAVTYAAVLKALDAKRETLTEGEGDPEGGFLDGLLGGRDLDRVALRRLVRDLAAGLGDLLKGALPDPRLEAYAEDVAAPLAAAATPAATDDAAQDALLAALLALADFVRAEAGPLWQAIAAGAPAGLSAGARAAYDLLAGAALGGSDWRALLADADAHRVDVVGGRVTPAVKVVALELGAAAIAASAAAVAEPLRRAVAAALAEVPLASASTGTAAGTSTTATTSTTSGTPTAKASGDALYVVRCVYERPRCRDAVVSDASAPFRLASFFDAEAPVRPTRILMPDVTMKALRKAPRGVTIALSKELRAQIERVRGVKLDDLGKGNLNAPQGFDLGLVCSLSIPIITIVALLLLIVMVSVLNLLFWWLPFFVICFPRIGRRS